MRRCVRCVMDDSADRLIRFDNKGVCNYCREQYKQLELQPWRQSNHKELLEDVVYEIKRSGEGKEYDCIMGLSGGLDSSYVAYLAYKLGLKVLLIVIDDGYNTMVSEENICKLIDRTGFDCETLVVDQKQYNSLVLSYFKAGVPNAAVPQDNVVFSILHNKQLQYGIEYSLSGGNFALECLLQRDRTHSYWDNCNILDIHNKFGNGCINKLPILSYDMVQSNVKKYGLKSVRLLDYVEYNRDRAFLELNEFCGFEYYGRKHLENKLTAFIQLYWFPKKFGVDKRTSHLSSMIVSGQLTRDRALEELEEPLFLESDMNEYIDAVKKGLGLSEDQFERIMCSDVHSHDEYETEELKWVYNMQFVKENCPIVRFSLKKYTKALSEGMLIWGTGEWTERVIDDFSIPMKSIIAFVDNNKQMQGGEWSGKPIISPQEFYEKYKGRYIVIANPYYNSIVNQMRDEGGFDSSKVVNMFDYIIGQCL